MARQLSLDLNQRKKPPKGGWLATELTRHEQREFGRLYVKHQGLIRLIGSKLCKRFPMVESLDVFSCIDIAFIKSCRAHDPSKGKFSTIFTTFAAGEVRHFIRDHNWMVKAPSKLREMSTPARKLLGQNYSLAEVAVMLGVSKETVKESILATTGIDHEIQGFELHECPRDGPMDLLIAEESTAAN